MAFLYQALYTNEVRLLKPVSRSSNTLSFELIHASLLSKPRYVALSYTWGPPGGTHIILLNGQYFAIRRNLDHALQQIHSSKLVDQYLWVDAICINQNENEDARNERSVQITHMTQIYEQAASIIVWLGKPENEANNRLAFSMMKDFGSRYRRVRDEGRPYRPWWWLHKPRTVGQDVADFMLTILPARDKKVYDLPGSATHNAWLGIIALWKSPWWTRTWVFQDSTIPERYKTMYMAGVFVLPLSSKVRLFCGEQETNWNELAVTSMIASNILSTPGISSQFLVSAQHAVDRLIQFRSQRIQHVLRSFLEILQMFRCTECLDPRDKVYAPLCLAPDDVRHCIKPDYNNKTVLDVYIDVVQYYLAQPGQELDFLGYALYQEESQAVQTPQGIKSVSPSWVPNFSARIDVIPLPKILHVPENLDQRRLTIYDRRGVPSNREAIVTAYRPLGDTPSRSFIQGSTLYASGVYIDILIDIMRETGPNPETIRAVAREKGRKWAIDSKHRYFTGESFGDAITRTAVLDLIYNELGRPSERGGKLDTAFLRRPRAELSLTDYRHQMNMRSAKNKSSTLREMALSQKYHLLMAPNTAVAGDEIWALAGGQALFILRPMNRELRQYIYIGECYVHGLMDGEILRRLHFGEARMEDISLN